MKIIKGLLSTALTLMILLNNTVVFAGIKEDQHSLVSNPKIYASVNSYDELIERACKAVYNNEYIDIKIPAELLNTISTGNALWRKIMNYKSDDESKMVYDLSKYIDSNSIGVKRVMTADGKEVDYGLITISNNTFNRYATEAQLDALENYMNNVIDELDLYGISDYNKVVRLEKFMRDNFTYNLISTQVRLSTACSTGSMVCCDYSTLMQSILGRIGVESVLANGYQEGSNDNTVSHTWLLIKLNDKWYWNDTTWNDTSNSDTYFLKGSDTFKNHTIAPISIASIAKYDISDTDYSITEEDRRIEASISNLSIDKNRKFSFKIHNAKSKTDKVYLNDKRLDIEKRLTNFKIGDKIKIIVDNKEFEYIIEKGKQDNNTSVSFKNLK